MRPNTKSSSKTMIARGYFGQKKVVQKVLLYIDQPDEFAGLINNGLDLHAGKTNEKALTFKY